MVKQKVTFKLLNGKDETIIDKELEASKKIGSDVSPELTTRLRHTITSVNGDFEKATIREFVDTQLLARDARALRNYVGEMQPDVDLNFEYEEKNGDFVKLPIPITLNFFWPDATI